ncbi:alpha-L-rhamnosidase C-terminal domain-containing protein [Streptomyces sp. NPDC014892]|uniref:alpha-L-rhamnosidase C-terminal domain-containing protein n=1 Tax=Streptomyces sp. NPDC014892 TaxID=3364930 RepID=UPI0036FEB040
MLSFNHYAYGAVAAWLYRSVAGLRPLSPGYRTLEFAPRPGATLTSAEASIATPYGIASVAWSLSDDTLTVRAVLPPGTTGRFSAPEGWQPAEAVGELASGSHQLSLRPSSAGRATHPGRPSA